MKKLPILIIIPHGGTKAPEELKDYTIVSDFELFMSSDCCANEIFSFDESSAAVLKTDISPLYTDLNRSIMAVGESRMDGVVKRATPYGKEIYPEDTFPNEVAITNILKRYYLPYHEALDKILKSGEIKLAIECHTTMPVGPKHAADADKPRPIVEIQSIIEKNLKTMESAPQLYCKFLLDELAKNFSSESAALPHPFLQSSSPSTGYILNNYIGLIPMVRINISRGLFINNQHFNDHYLKVDQIRLNQIKKKIWSAISKSYKKFFR